MRIIDLSVPVHTGMPHLPVPLYFRNPATVKVIGTMDFEQLLWLQSNEIDCDAEVMQDYGAMSTRIQLVVHGSGTHVDAPRHFVRDGTPIDKYPLENVVGEAVALDTPVQAGGMIDAAMLEKAGKDVQNGDIIIIRSGWNEKMWGKEGYWSTVPGITEDAGEWLEKKQPKALCTDCFNDIPIFRLKNTGYTIRTLPNHNRLLSKGIALVEWITNTSQIRERRLFFSAAPLKLRGMDSGPARAYAIEGLLRK